MKLIPALVILFILDRTIFAFSIMGVHSAKYTQGCFYTFDSVLFVILGLLCMYLLKKQKGYCRVIIKWGIGFCFSLAPLLLFYSYLPDNLSVYLVPVIYSYFVIWGIVSVGLIGYYIFCIKGDLL